MASETPKLTTMLGNYPDTAALKKGELKPKLFDFDFAEVKVANQLFKSIVRDAKYDIGELAIVTFLQAKTFNKPYVLLPSVIVGARPASHHRL